MRYFSKTKTNLHSGSHSGSVFGHKPELLTYAHVSECHNGHRNYQNDGKHVELIQLSYYGGLKPFHAPVRLANSSNCMLNLNANKNAYHSILN